MFIFKIQEKIGKIYNKQNFQVKRNFNFFFKKKLHEKFIYCNSKGNFLSYVDGIISCKILGDILRRKVITSLNIPNKNCLISHKFYMKSLILQKENIEWKNLTIKLIKSKKFTFNEILNLFKNQEKFIYLNTNQFLFNENILRKIYWNFNKKSIKNFIFSHFQYIFQPKNHLKDKIKKI